MREIVRYDRDGIRISVEEWTKLTWIVGYEDVAFDEIETENVIIQTKWTGVPDDEESGNLEGIFVTLVKIPYSLFSEKFPGDGGYVVKRYPSSGRAYAAAIHRATIEIVYSGVLDIPFEIRKWWPNAKSDIKRVK